MPGWLQAISKVNPVSYEVDALRGLLIGGADQPRAGVGVLVASAIAGVIVSSALLPAWPSDRLRRPGRLSGSRAGGPPPTVARC